MARQWRRYDLFITDSRRTTSETVGLVVKASASRAEERKIPGSNPACAGIFPGSSHTSDLKIGTPVATLPGAWRYRVSAGTGWPSVSMWLGDMESLICNFYLSVAARKIVRADPSRRYTTSEGEPAVFGPSGSVRVKKSYGVTCLSKVRKCGGGFPLCVSFLRNIIFIMFALCTHRLPANACIVM